MEVEGSIAAFTLHWAHGRVREIGASIPSVASRLPVANLDANDRSRSACSYSAKPGMLLVGNGQHPVHR